MKLMHPCFEEPLELIEGIPNILVVEEKSLRIRIIEDLLLQVQNGEGNFVLSENDDILRIDKVAEFLTDPFSLDINQKKILSKVQSTLKELAGNESNYAETIRVIGELNSYFEKLGAQVQYPIVFNENMDFQDLIKISGAKIASESETFFENLINYICLINDVLGITLLITWNLQLYINEEELKELFKIANYKKINLILIESFDLTEHSLLERVTIIDKDLCVIRNF
ncbi:MAG: type II-A CRISPR-associated protein Csn2 [Peptostreptococcaceae bacterium]|nr:type II-A CRISPR-associated protein Csn2 [Peptostreptococcaceae bacterium]